MTLPAERASISIACASWSRHPSRMSASERGVTRSSDCDLLIVGGGPCGLAAAISAQRAGLKSLVLESRVICSTIAHYPTYVRFFSTAERLSLGDVPFVVATEKPTRRDALAYYRSIVQHFRIPVRQYEHVTSIETG